MSTLIEIMRTQFGILALGPWVLTLALALACSIQARADALLDFTMFNPPAAAQRQISEPVVNWLVKPDAQTYCETVQPKDGFHARPEGCVYWERSSSTCTIVTTNNTTHSQLGHLFVRCLRGQ